MVYLDEGSIDAYLGRHGFGVVYRTFYRLFYRIIGDRPARGPTDECVEVAKAQLRSTKRHRRELAVIGLGSLMTEGRRFKSSPATDRREARNSR